MTLTFTAIQLFILPLDQNSAYRLPMGLLFGTSLALFLGVSFKDPGFVSRPKNISFLKLNQYFHPSYVCSSCEVLMSADSRHCYICNKCVSRFDHHCQWMNTCIGVGNHHLFLLFLLFTEAYLATTLALLLSNIQTSTNFSVMVKGGDYSFKFSEEIVKVWFQITLWTSLLLCLFFLLPLSLMVLIHTQNFLSNQTTARRMSAP